MKNKSKLEVIVLLTLVTSFVACSTPIKNSSKEIIVLEENVDKEKKEELGLELVYKIRNYGGERYNNVSLTEIGLMMIRDKLVHLDLKMHGKSDYETEKVSFGEIKEEKDEEGFNIVEWQDSDIKGKVILGVLEDNDFRLEIDGSIYNIKDDLTLNEIEGYRDLDTKNIYYYNGIKDDVDLVDFKNKTEVINLKSNTSFSIENLEELVGADTLDYENFIEYGIVGEENNKLYIAIKDGAKGGDKNLKLGYIENNELKIILDESLEVKSNNIDSTGEHEIIVYNNKVIFSGIINEVSGIWKYDISNKELNLELELAKEENPNIFISPNKRNLVITTSKWNKEKMVNTFGTYIGNLDENMSIKNITNVSLNTGTLGISKYFSGFSENSKKIYMKCYDYENEELDIYYEIYEIVD